MKINSLNIALASAITTAVVWVICSLLVWMIPGAMMNLSGNMIHMEMGKGGWIISPISVIWGLIAWSLFVGVFAWILATIYNVLTKD